ncbi:MAG: hypothetical protein ICV60_05590 [Pyrinomonadaceae bacterium]|nr:hypothetical protein [Pyrinomonadaceae bacterium]
MRQQVEFDRATEFTDDSQTPDKCLSLWNGQPCPHPPEFLIVTKSRVGFAVMCLCHKTRYEQFDTGDDYTVEPYSLERALELQQLVKETYG